MHVCVIDTLSLIGKGMCISPSASVLAVRVMKVSGVGRELWQTLVDVQCRKPPVMVTTTSEVLDELGLKEEATQLRGWLVCQSYQVSDCFDSVIVAYPITSFLTVLSELYQKRLISEDDLRHLLYHHNMGYSSRHWLDTLVDYQSSKSADVCARTFDTLRRYSLTEVRKERQTERTGVTAWFPLVCMHSYGTVHRKHYVTRKLVTVIVDYR